MASLSDFFLAGIMVAVESFVYPVDIRADHPFIITLEDTASGTQLFTGLVTSPQT